MPLTSNERDFLYRFVRTDDAGERRAAYRECKCRDWDGAEAAVTRRIKELTCPESGRSDALFFIETERRRYEAELLTAHRKEDSERFDERALKIALRRSIGEKLLRKLEDPDLSAKGLSEIAKVAEGYTKGVEEQTGLSQDTALAMIERAKELSKPQGEVKPSEVLPVTPLAGDSHVGRA